MDQARRLRRGLVIASSTILVAGLAACGTTVRNPPSNGQVNGLAAPTSGAATGAGQSQVAASTGPAVGGLPTTTLTGGALPSNSVGSGSSSSHASSGGSGGGGGGGSTSQGSTGLAITNGPGKLSPVEVGMVYISDADAFAALFGGSAKVGDQLKEAEAAVNWVNAHGGLGGHPIVPDYYKQSITNTAPYSTFMSSICSSWTQDHHVIAGTFIGANVPDQLAQCLNAKGVTYLSGGFYLHDQSTYESLPNFFSPYEASSDRAMTALVNSMLAGGKITSKDKVGVLLMGNDPAAARTYNNVVVPKLSAKGIKVASYNVDFPASTLDAASSLKEVSNDQLHMRADGITKVLFLAPGGEETFMKDASNQHWSPSYGIDSENGPIALAADGSGVAAQLANTTGIGWEPVADVGTYGNSVFTNSATALCQSIEGPTGQITGDTSQFAAYQWCDTLLSLQAAANIEGTQSTLTSALLSNGLTRLGNRSSAMVLGEDVSSSAHAAVDEYRPLTYGSSCSCFTYSGSPVRF